MDYKSTLNLPQTSFPMRARLPEREPERLAEWQRMGLYEKMQEQRRQAPLFLLHDGPPYANGHIHIGHALNKVLKDIVLKYKHLAGFRTPYRPGWDCHGLPIELEVEKALGREAAESADVLAVRARCRQWADRFVAIQSEEFQRLGVLGDWKAPYRTTDYDYEAQEARELAKLIASGALYRGRKPVYWCASCRTALAEAEVEYGEHRSVSVYVAFEVPAGQGALARFAGERPAIAIWTTTPWTLPANLAIALHPHFPYALVRAGQRSLLVAEPLVETLREKLGLGETLATFRGSELEGIRARHPWLERDSVVVLGEHVTLEAGTGCVHTAPGHGEEDYSVGIKYGLEPYAPVDDSGCFTQEVEDFAGRFVFDTDEQIVALLDRRGALLAREDVQHSYPHCWRCKNPIVFRATEQWFVALDANGLRERALAEIDRVKWIPAWGRDRIHGMIANRPDWCLSRQRAWGVPVIAVRCNSCGTAATDARLAERAAELFAREGSDAWFRVPVEDLLPPDFACRQCGARDFEKERDILDVWFDSGVSFACVIERDHGQDAVADLYLEGSDQHRGWFHSALLTATATRQRAPYRAVLTHGFVLDGEGRKMSKSLGNVVAPQEVIERYGADILRLWVAAEDYRDDVRISEEILGRLADSYRRVRNTARNMLGNLADFDPVADRVEPAAMRELDRWALGRLYGFLERCRKAYEQFEFHIVYHALNNFCSVDLSALYFDIVKDRLYCDARQSTSRRAVQTVMYDTLVALARILAPILSFTAEEIWQALPGGPPTASVFLTDFPVPDPSWRDEALASRWERIWELRGAITKALEERRKAGALGHSLDARIRLGVGPAERRLCDELGHQELAAVAIVSQVELVDSASGEVEVEVLEPEGAKCQRCWIWSTAVGTHPDHPGLCDRCHAVVSAQG
ncbi:MAG: isoleucine--tRNA ligase [Candidatus Dadabacteria bacterium]|nr:MAG: isoleucine--tRNA ligase [Candidatus Dadabacteria bacterium]